MAAAIPIATKVIGGLFTARTVKNIAKPKGGDTVQVKPAEPTIDDAAKNQGEVDRIKRRRGVLANVFGGARAAAASPTVAVKKLLGE
jgi:hypothetical protein